MKPISSKLKVLALFSLASAILSLSLFAQERYSPPPTQNQAPSTSNAQVPQIPKDDYDALDGRGPSKVRIDAIVWENNLELHVYPPDSLAGLGVTFDPKKQNILVAAYRLARTPGKKEIRRLITDGANISAKNFKVYLDKSNTKGDDPAELYDKYIITGNTLAGKLQLVQLDPAPTQLYPDGHPNLAPPEDKNGARPDARIPAQNERQPVEKTPVSNEPARQERFVDDNGAIKSFSF